MAQFYHFAFLVVSLALLGFGAAGTYLASAKRPERWRPAQAMGGLSFAAGVSMLGAYALVNWLPFDSFSIAWDVRQVFLLIVNCLGLSIPFFFSGMAIGLLLAAYPQRAGNTYAINLIGSACGCIFALAAPTFIGGEGVVALSSGIAALAGLASAQVKSIRLGSLLLTCLAVVDLSFCLSGAPLPWLSLRISPYKSLSYALQYPGARLISQRWNAFSRVDVVQSPGIRSFPGLSYRYQQPLPAQDGLLVDGDEISPVLLPGYTRDFFQYLPTAVAFQLRPNAQTLVLEPRGGLDILTALEMGAQQVTAVEANPLVVRAASSVYSLPKVSVQIEAGRSYIRRSQMHFDVIVLSLASSYHPVRSGAYSLAEDYRYTAEAFQDIYARLDEDGILVVSRWLQVPPSEELRAFALAVTAVENLGGDPRQQIVALRGYNLATLLVRKGNYSADELQYIRKFASERAFDLIYAPDTRPEETNRYNRLAEPVYYQRFVELLDARPRGAFYAAYPYDVRPPTDDHPFFGHFFKWSQAGEVWAELGKTWQPFGGAGYFVILALLGVTALLAILLILLPALVAGEQRRKISFGDGLSLAYFGLIGLAYLLIEIPLMQRFILFLGSPAYALATILFTLLLFSGLGSQFSRRAPLRLSLIALGALALSLPVLLPLIFSRTLSWALPFRLGLTAALLAPVGLLMGIPFPAGIDGLLTQRSRSSLISWAWAVNGAASVIASVLAALLALSFGFGWVLRLGALLYLAACITTLGALQPNERQSQPT